MKIKIETYPLWFVLPFQNPFKWDKLSRWLYFTLKYSLPAMLQEVFWIRKRFANRDWTRLLLSGVKKENLPKPTHRYWILTVLSVRFKFILPY